MKTLYHMLSMFCIVVAMTALGLLATMGLMGRLSKDNLAALGRMARGEAMVERPTPTTQPTTQPSEAPPPAAERLQRTQEATELAGLLVERRMAELGYQKTQLENLERLSRQERDKLSRDRKAWAKEIALARADKDDTGLRQQIKLMESLKPAQVKDILKGMPEDEAAIILAGMKKYVATDVMAKFSTEDEKTLLQRLLKKMRSTG
jgi:flagellar motility protein MotE (MotC chaperone)